MNIKTEADADKAGLKHIETEAEIAQLEADQAAEIAKIKERFGSKIKGLKKENGDLLDKLGEWFWGNPDQRDPGTKQITLNTVRLSERETKKYKWPAGKNLEALMKKVKKLGLPFIRTKEELNKKKIQDEANADQLKAMGIKVEPIVTVYVEQV